MDEAQREILEYAYSESEFYCNLQKKSGTSREDYLNDWEKVPIVTKNEIILSRQSVVPYRYYARLGNGRISCEHTSGSTGKCMDVYWDNREMAKSMAPLWLARKKYYGILPQDRYCYFYTLRKIGEPDAEQEYFKNGLGFSKVNLTDERIHSIYERMLAFQPVWLLLQPSIAVVLARYVFEQGAGRIDSLRYIELSGEMCSRQNQRFLQNAFQVPVANQYGCNEANSIAYECPCGNLHIMESNVFVEIIKDGKAAPAGETGNIVITSKHNHVMPFVRYDTGDFGYFVQGQCRCGNTGRLLKLTGARENDRVRTKSGEYLSVYEFIRAFRAAALCIDGNLLQYQIVQKDFSRFDIHIVTDEDHDKLEYYFLKNLWNPCLMEAEYRFIYHDRLLPEEGCGKLKMFRCECT